MSTAMRTGMSTGLIGAAGEDGNFGPGPDAVTRGRGGQEARGTR